MTLASNVFLFVCHWIFVDAIIQTFIYEREQHQDHDNKEESVKERLNEKIPHTEDHLFSQCVQIVALISKQDGEAPLIPQPPLNC